MLVALFATTSSIMAQKAKQNVIDTSKRVIYSCPMHPDVVSNTPGKCSKCAMDLMVSKKEQMKMDAVKYTCPMHPEVSNDMPGTCSKCGKALTASKKEQMKMDVMKIYTCPMHPDVKTDAAGNCPKCGMKLTQAKPANN